MKSVVPVIGAILSLCPSIVSAQNYPAQMQPAADYARCVTERARGAEPKSDSVDDAIESALGKCKGARSKAMSAVRARMGSVGLPAAMVKQSAETMMNSSDRSLAESLKQELTKTRSDRLANAQN